MPPRVDLTPRQIKSMVAMREHGATFEQIGKRFGVSYGTACRLYREHAPKPKTKAHK